jgi:hypothetical protein
VGWGEGRLLVPPPRPPGPSELFVVVRHHTDVVGPHPLKDALGFHLVYYIPQPRNLRHLLLVRIDEVELVKQQLFSLVFTFGCIYTTLMSARMPHGTTFGRAGPPTRQLRVPHYSCLALRQQPPGCFDEPETWQSL